jgi:hypothetical protein
MVTFEVIQVFNSSSGKVDSVPNLSSIHFHANIVIYFPLSWLWRFYITLLLLTILLGPSNLGHFLIKLIKIQFVNLYFINLISLILLFLIFVGIANLRVFVV